MNKKTFMYLKFFLIVLILFILAIVICNFIDRFLIYLTNLK